MDGWGDRVYSVISKEAPGGSGAAAEKESRDGWAGQFPVHLHARDVENAFVAEMARRGHGAVEVKICPTSMEMKYFQSGCPCHHQQWQKWVVHLLQV